MVLPWVMGLSPTLQWTSGSGLPATSHLNVGLENSLASTCSGVSMNVIGMATSMSMTIASFVEVWKHSYLPESCCSKFSNTRNKTAGLLLFLTWTLKQKGTLSSYLYLVFWKFEGKTSFFSSTYNILHNTSKELPEELKISFSTFYARQSKNNKRNELYLLYCQADTCYHSFLCGRILKNNNNNNKKRSFISTCFIFK